MTSDTPSQRPSVVGRYVVHDEIAHGGMATVHIGRLAGSGGFRRTVAIKRLHPQYAKDPEFVTMFLDEAHLAARIHHPNVVPTLDVVAMEGELCLVMELVRGQPLQRLIRAASRRGSIIPPPMVSRILVDALQGLHAAHEATDDQSNPLHIVHRDVSPQNILVGADGVARVVDFGVAKATHRVQTTHGGKLKGKHRYMTPEQLTGKDVDRRTDVFAAGIVLWEALTLHTLFGGREAGETLMQVMHKPIEPPSQVENRVPSAVDAVVLRALHRRPAERFSTALEMAKALEDAIAPAKSRDVGEWVSGMAAPELQRLADRVADVESQSGELDPDLVAALAAMDREVPSSRIPSNGRLLSSSSSVEAQPTAAVVPPTTDSVSSGAVLPPDERRPRYILWALVGLFLICGGAALGIGYNVVRLRSPPAPPLPSAAAETGSLAAESTTAPSASSIEVPSHASAAAASASSSVPPSDPVVRSRPGGRRKKPVAPRPKPDDCRPPYTVDSKGLKHFKTHCL